MPLELTSGLDTTWVDLLLLLGWVLTIASGFAIALCLVGGCLDAMERRRAGQHGRDRSAGRGRRIAVLEATVTELAPVNLFREETRAVDDGVEAFCLCTDVQQEANRARIQLREEFIRARR